MYLNLIQIAESFGVAEKVVEGWIRDEGLPYTPDRSRLLFDRAQVTEWAAERGLAAGGRCDGKAAVLLHCTLAARTPRPDRPVEPLSGPWTFAGVGGERRSG